MRINHPVFGPIGAVLVVFGNLGRPVGLPRHGPSAGNLAIFPEKRPYLGLGGPNRDSEGTFLGYHPLGLVVSTRS